MINFHDLEWCRKYLMPPLRDIGFTFPEHLHEADDIEYAFEVLYMYQRAEIDDRIEPLHVIERRAEGEA